MSTRIRDIADREVRERKTEALINLWLVRIPLIAWVVFAAIVGLAAKHDNFGAFLVTLGATGYIVLPPVALFKIAIIINNKL